MKKSLPRRSFLDKVALGITSFLTIKVAKAENINDSNTMESSILKIKPMGFQWETADPFLFCVHHEDNFPKGTAEFGPDAAYLNGRNLGDDFIIKDGFRMYHGKKVPGFPGHPHRGFETITVVRKGMVDHADSLGAAGRYGNGDVQWMTAGKGVQHSEMFPLLNRDKGNPLELFQIWLNLPAKNKMTDPHFKMLWSEEIPRYTFKNIAGKNSVVEVISGSLYGKTPPAPPPNSWAFNPANHVAVWNISMESHASFILPSSAQGVNRILYCYEGTGIKIDGQSIPYYSSVKVKPDASLSIESNGSSSKILVLQGKPIGEQVIQYGPFVMNTKDEINQAFEDFHRTGFGGWPWPSTAQVHGKEKGRFARHADGRIENKV